VNVAGVSHEKSKDSTVADFTIGGRFGYWLCPVPWLGFALDTSYYQFDVTPKHAQNLILQDAKIQVIPITPMVMARVPLLESSEFPTGRLQPYIGAGPGIFLHHRKIDFESGDRIRNETMYGQVWLGDSRLSSGFLPSTGSTTFPNQRTPTSPRVALTLTPMSTSTPVSPVFVSPGEGKQLIEMACSGRWTCGLEVEG
jgi:hypothetical protein